MNFKVRQVRFKSGYLKGKINTSKAELFMDIQMVYTFWPLHFV